MNKSELTAALQECVKELQDVLSPQGSSRVRHPNTAEWYEARIEALEAERDKFCDAWLRVDKERLDLVLSLHNLRQENERLKEHLRHVITCRSDYGCGLCDNAFEDAGFGDELEDDDD